MSIFRHGLHIVGKQLIYLVLTLVMVLALLVGAVYWMSEEIGQRQDEIASWISNKLGYPVDIEAVGLHWLGLVPKLQIESLTILQKDRQAELLNLKQLYFGIDLIASIQQGDIVLGDITLTEANSTVIRDELGQIKVQGFNNIESGLPSSADIDWLGWISLLNHFNLQKITIDYTDNLYAELSGQYQFDNIIVNHDDKRWALQGHVQLPTALGDDITFQAEADFEEQNFQQTAWQFQLQATDLRWQPLTTELVWQGVIFQQGHLNTTISGEGLGKQVNVLDAEVNLSAAKLVSLKKKDKLTPVMVEQFAGQLKWRQQQDSWQLSASEMQIEINGDLWPSTNFTIDRQQDEWLIAASYIRLSDLTAIALLTELSPNDIRQQQPAGDIDLLTVNYSEQEGLTDLDFNLRDGALLPWQGSPGVTGLTMSLKWGKEIASLNVDSH